ncbi:hypothetical protein EJ05DRAFT_288556 [Pseudovirgaria hyperparasitica]|uniref:Uncharacterized protein n=1 Tax=Pseudovirgaria hyperparasitica TaxID=470096 RepID=A0A6A6WD96_9PEZI|nr:uncharacterized protein EJ05DRAFT_288556 [Pseudovirgaria hyperparasitica]KAF2760545.1 hypothetical protein EJ05DRAFT_288556 [Pseudovirgaria hyperparasitica]
MNSTSLAASTGLKETLPVSQVSFVSTASSSTNATTASRLLSSSSSLSTSNGADTTLTSPTSSISNSSQPRHYEKTESTSKADTELVPTLDTGFSYRETQIPISATTGTEDSSSNDSTVTTPISLDAPVLVQGYKRTASGTVKGSIANNPNSALTEKARGHRRGTSNMSIDSTSTTRGSELAAQLKARLSYAMVKVQHGWEHHTLDELEEQASQISSPVAPRNREQFRHSDSPQYLSRNRRLSAYSDHADRPKYSPGHEIWSRGISRSMDTTPSSFTYKDSHSNASVHRAFLALNTTGGTQTSHETQENGLAPAAPIISSRRNRRAHTTNTPPPFLSTVEEGKTHNGVPRTPRQGILRMPSQQDEKDAVDTLLFMSSPNNSAYFANQAHSPYKAELRSKRVAFDAGDRTNGLCNPHYPMQA